MNIGLIIGIVSCVILAFIIIKCIYEKKKASVQELERQKVLGWPGGSSI